MCSLQKEPPISNSEMSNFVLTRYMSNFEKRPVHSVVRLTRSP
jgi:hypothetical protein